ncbi:MAG TPA: hypothetical protein VLU96_00385 [Gaiellaceae bacterium]|nr:hypothetical protein [Gaiellaceae bacterium]
MIFRREPLHRKLAREAGLELDPDSESATETPLGPAPAVEPEPTRAPEQEPVDLGPRWGVTGLHGVPRPRRWDTVDSVEATGLRGDEVHFVALPNGELVVDEDEPDGALVPLAEAIEANIEPPYRAEAVRREDDVWAVAARRVRIAELDAPGDRIELAVNGDERTLVVDGESIAARIPELERLAEREGAAYVARAERVDETLWEVEIDLL